MRLFVIRLAIAAPFNPLRHKEMQMQQQPLLVNGKKAAQMLGISQTTFWRWKKEGLVKEVPKLHPPMYSVKALVSIAEGEQIDEVAA